MKVFDIISIGFMIGFGIALSVIIILASMSGWEITLAFNDFHEGIIELILFPVITIMGFITLIRYIKRVK